MAPFLSMLGLVLVSADSDTQFLGRKPEANSSTVMGLTDLHLVDTLATIHLDIPGRRQWDCFYANYTCSPWLVSSTSHEVAMLDDKHCHCGEWQCHRADVCDCYQEPVAHTCDGFCAATSLQEAGLSFGAYISLGVMRTFLWSENHQEILTCIPEEADAPYQNFQNLTSFLGFQSTSLCNTTASATSPYRYDGFIRGNLLNGYPVAMGVWVNGVSTTSEMYQHVVLAVGEKGNKWVINDHYDHMPIEIPLTSMTKDACDRSNWKYCVAADAGGVSYSAVAIRPPPVSCPASLRIDGCANEDFGDKRCAMSGAFETNGWVEPNWSIQGMKPVKYRFWAAPAKDCRIQSQSLVAVKIVLQSGEHTDGARPLRDIVAAHGSPFNAPASECFLMKNGTVDIGTVSSKDTLFVQFVAMGSDEHQNARCPQ